MITLRSEKGAPLTHEEMDRNFVELMVDARCRPNSEEMRESIADVLVSGFTVEEDDYFYVSIEDVEDYARVFCLPPQHKIVFSSNIVNAEAFYYPSLRGCEINWEENGYSVGGADEQTPILFVVYIDKEDFKEAEPSYSVNILDESQGS